MAKEYIERGEALMGVMRAGCLANTVQVLKDIHAADVIEVFWPEEDVLAEFEDDYKDFKKIKTHLAQIIVEGEIEKPCYSILWWDEESKEYNIGYSSYCLDYVRKWLELVFDVVEEADVVEVVRCKDCKGMIDEDHFCYVWEGFVRDDDFCSYGERRDDDG